MANVRANGIQIEYDTFGDRSGRPLLLVMGLGAQMIHWRAGLCEQLADAGHFVVRYDNRDVGFRRSSMSAGAAGHVRRSWAQMAAGEPISAPYTLDDMARRRGSGLLDALDMPAGARLRRVDGRHDRAGDGDSKREAREEPDVDHVEHRQSRTAAGKTGGDGPR